MKRKKLIPQNAHVVSTESAWANEETGVRYSLTHLDLMPIGHRRLFADNHSTATTKAQQKIYQEKDTRWRGVLSGETNGTQSKDQSGEGGIKEWKNKKDVGVYDRIKW